MIIEINKNLNTEFWTVVRKESCGLCNFQILKFNIKIKIIYKMSLLRNLLKSYKFDYEVHSINWEVQINFIKVKKDITSVSNCKKLKQWRCKFKLI